MLKIVYTLNIFSVIAERMVGGGGAYQLFRLGGWKIGLWFVDKSFKQWYVS